MQDSPAHSVVVVKTGFLIGHPASPNVGEFEERIMVLTRVGIE